MVVNKVEQVEAVLKLLNDYFWEMLCKYLTGSILLPVLHSLSLFSGGQDIGTELWGGGHLVSLHPN